jgi:hypothetical protein
LRSYFGDDPVMGFNRRKREAERKAKADAEAATRRAAIAPPARTTRDIDLRTLDRHRDAAVTSLIPRCPADRAG